MTGRNLILFAILLSLTSCGSESPPQDGETATKPTASEIPTKRIEEPSQTASPKYRVGQVVRSSDEGKALVYDSEEMWMNETRADQELAYEGKHRHMSALPPRTQCKILKESLPVYQVVVADGPQRGKKWWIRETWLQDQGAPAIAKTDEVVPDLGLSVDSFERRMRIFAKDAGPSFAFSLAEKQEITNRYNVAPEISLVVMTHKGRIANIALFSRSDPSTTLSACGYLLRACEPNMDDDARSTVLRELGVATIDEPLFSLHHQTHANNQNFSVAADGKTFQLGVMPAGVGQ